MTTDTESPQPLATTAPPSLRGAWLAVSIAIIVVMVSIAAITVVAVAIAYDQEAHAATAHHRKPHHKTHHRHWSRRVTSSWYGPGFYRHRTYCGQRLKPTTRGVAHKHLPCGTLVLLRSRGRIVRARVIDRGPFVKGRTFDLTERTMHQLCHCRRPGLIKHKWARA